MVPEQSGHLQVELCPDAAVVPASESPLADGESTTPGVEPGADGADDAPTRGLSPLDSAGDIAGASGATLPVHTLVAPALVLAAVLFMCA